MKVYKAEEVVESFVLGGHKVRSPLLEIDRSGSLLLRQKVNGILRTTQIAYKAWGHIFYRDDIHPQAYRYLKSFKNRVPIESQDWVQFHKVFCEVVRFVNDPSKIERNISAFANSLSDLQIIFESNGVEIGVDLNRYREALPKSRYGISAIIRRIALDLIIQVKYPDQRFVSAWNFEYKLYKFSLSELESTYKIVGFNMEQWLLIDSEHDDCMIHFMNNYGAVREPLPLFNTVEA